MDKYKSIVKHYENCFKEFGDTHKGLDWPNQDDLYARYKVALDIIIDGTEEVSILDFGCGTAGLFEYILKNNYPTFKYSGLDLGKLYIKKCREKYPNNAFYHVDILEDQETLPNFDYIILNGVFTEKRELTFDEMWSYFTKMISVIYKNANKGVAFNVMSKAVEWERNDLFHLSTDLLIEFLTKNITRDFVIRNDYGLYEYFVYIRK